MRTGKEKIVKGSLPEAHVSLSQSKLSRKLERLSA